MRNFNLKTKNFYKKNRLVFARVLVPSAVLLLPGLVLAAGTGYVPLEGSVTGGQNVANFGDYLKRVYEIGITITIVLAVLYLVIGGFGYMTSSTSITDKEGAKSKMTNAILGLLLALLSYVILNTVSPQFTKFSLNISEVGKSFNTVPAGTVVGGGIACFDCVTFTGMPVKSTACENGVCKLNSALADGLAAFNKESPGLRLTEGYPKTTTHVNPCHDNGTCADINYAPKPPFLNTPPTPERVASDIKLADKHGIQLVYEVTTREKADALLKSGNFPKGSVIYVPGILADHYSAYLKK